jgi:hypothetical protein
LDDDEIIAASAMASSAPTTRTYSQGRQNNYDTRPAQQPERVRAACAKGPFV